jgi:hypothetical protein
LECLSAGTTCGLFTLAGGESGAARQPTPNNTASLLTRPTVEKNAWGTAACSLRWNHPVDFQS